jgi:hypothetical protein
MGLGWSADAPPALLLLLVGAALGPQALAILTPPVLSALDPALPVALAALGVHVALGLPFSRDASDDASLILRASLQGLLTGVLVAGGMLLLQTPGLAPPTFHAWVVALVAGACAALSTRLVSDSDPAAQTIDVRVQQFDALLPLLAGAVILAWVREGSLLPALLLLVNSVGLALVSAAAGWLLLTRTTSDSDARILGAAVLLLVGGLADYLSMSALLSGLIAGLFWRASPGQAGEWLRRDVRHVLHPLIVLMLIVAGARVTVDTSIVTLAFGYVLLRALGKLTGAWVARRAGRVPLPADLGTALLAPGILGIAFVINAVRAAGPQADPLISIVVFGTIASGSPRAAVVHVSGGRSRRHAPPGPAPCRADGSGRAAGRRRPRA